MSRLNRLVAAALLAFASFTVVCPPAALACGPVGDEVAILDAVDTYVAQSYLPRHATLSTLDTGHGTATVLLSYMDDHADFEMDLARVDGSWQVLGWHHLARSK